MKTFRVYVLKLDRPLNDERKVEVSSELTEILGPRRARVRTVTYIEPRPLLYNGSVSE